MKRTKKLWKKYLKVLLLAGCLMWLGGASAKSIMCLKTDAGVYIEVVRVSMMVIPDGGDTFEIVVRDGQGATGVKSISFEKHESDIDLSKYQGAGSGDTYIDVSKPSWLVTSTGKHFLVKDVQMLANIDAQGVYEVVTNAGNETGVRSVSFFRGLEADIPGTGIVTIKEVSNVEQLQLLTPVSTQLSLSGCGDASSAIVYGLDGIQVASAEVTGGTTTILVGQLPAGVYIVKVGNKALKFTKK